MFFRMFILRSRLPCRNALSHHPPTRRRFVVLVSCRCVWTCRPKIRFNKPDAANYWCCDINSDFLSFHSQFSYRFSFDSIANRQPHCVQMCERATPKFPHQKTLIVMTLKHERSRERVSFFYYWTMNTLQVSLTKCSLSLQIKQLPLEPRTLCPHTVACAWFMLRCDVRKSQQKIC